jgi:hypothetical protein
MDVQPAIFSYSVRLAFPVKQGVLLLLLHNSASVSAYLSTSSHSFPSAPDSLVRILEDMCVGHDFLEHSGKSDLREVD